MKYVFQINENEEALKGFETMISYNVGGIAVTNNYGEITGIYYYNKRSP
jgi:predicted transcriptional regulator